MKKTVLLLSVIALLVGCSRGRNNYRRAAGSVWTTTYNIIYNSPADLTDSILACMRAVEKSLSPFDSSSLISRVNRSSEPVALDTMVARIFLASQKINRLSAGRFDPTVAPLVNLWGFGYRSGAEGDAPSDYAIDSALQLVGIDRCRIENNVIVKPHPATEFNFSAITKGFACDAIGEMFRANGVDDYMIEIGGEIALGGKNPDGQPWNIQIDAPKEAPGHDAMTVVPLTGCGIATSGNYRNFRETSAGRSWHTIDPATGRPAITETLSATVVAPTCMEADALATACMAMSPDSAIAMIRAYPSARALLILPPLTPSAPLRLLQTDNFPNQTADSH